MFVRNTSFNMLNDQGDYLIKLRVYSHKINLLLNRLYKQFQKIKNVFYKIVVVMQLYGSAEIYQNKNFIVYRLLQTVFINPWYGFYT